ncbi:MAG: hypothetical protein COA78_04005 [Blastopirellula sp.]|nr:MAG: hypothetical protein COA78_04005 [Blastopirellula sp.]
MNSFLGTPIFQSESSVSSHDHIVSYGWSGLDYNQVKSSIESDKLVLIRSIQHEQASQLFSELVNHYGLKESYDLQMQLVVHMMEGRSSINDIAVTVNEREPFQIIQPHSEGDSSSQLDLFSLYCSQNALHGGENVLSLINQSADHSNLRAKEKVIVGEDLTDFEVNELRSHHLDTKRADKSILEKDRMLMETSRGSIVVRTVPLEPARSAINGEELVTYWDNVTVHDIAFHRYQFELLNHLAILNNGGENNYESYMHLENDSDWVPADTNSGTLEQTSALFVCHIVHKMQPGDFLLFNNRSWTHSVNNWPPCETRKLSAMYA